MVQMDRPMDLLDLENLMGRTVHHYPMNPMDRMDLINRWVFRMVPMALMGPTILLDPMDLVHLQRQ
jgi:hypothetical protein